MAVKAGDKMTQKQSSIGLLWQRAFNEILEREFIRHARTMLLIGMARGSIGSDDAALREKIMQAVRRRAREFAEIHGLTLSEMRSIQRACAVRTVRRMRKAAGRSGYTPAGLEATFRFLAEII